MSTHRVVHSFGGQKWCLPSAGSWTAAATNWTVPSPFSRLLAVWQGVPYAYRGIRHEHRSEDLLAAAPVCTRNDHRLGNAALAATPGQAQRWLPAGRTHL